MVECLPGVCEALDSMANIRTKTNQTGGLRKKSLQHISNKSTLSKHRNNIIKSLCFELGLEYRPFACKVRVHALALNPGCFGQKGFRV